ncbi:MULTISPECIES: SDR family NAD(P)-dependent oxidoreductase [Cupriavidus]|uniref:Short-chain dehydrogenase/reductase SDR n=1 Tax=Cupriavidus pinatubonensis (strain JMP 134 / LMG 1197) TaxID=264198 RepID=Q46QS9_CUPPJ|nr:MULTISPECIES: SDR family oxidoreductase [Cupriavidus]TPQ33131.1 SDR family NAD(P)-dependent oxidoreductase [Cupriavidus pinatubonensis]
MKLNDRVAVLTGAGGGIGRSLALALARRGCHLALADIDEHGLRETARMAGKSGVHTSQHVLDVACRAAVAALPHAVVQEHDQVDLVINNAGVALGGTFEEVSEADFDWVMAVNFEGVVRMTRAFLPLLRERQQARIVNISSLFGLIAPPGHAAYCASKFAVRGFSNALRHELAGTPIGVTVVHPGGVTTSIARHARTPSNLCEEEVRQGRADFEKLLRMPPQKAAEIIVRAVQVDRERVLVGHDAVISSWLERLMPTSYWRLIGRAMPSRN